MNASAILTGFRAVSLGLMFSSNAAFAAAEADLLVAYDQTHASAVGGQDNANVLAANAVAGSNAINERSGTGARVRIVGYHQAAQYSYQRTSKGGFVNWMANYDSRLADVVDAGNARGADLVTFLCVSTADGAAAVAQQPGRYSAFDPGSFWSAVVAHELGGHNYGCDHRGGQAVPGQKTVMMHNYCDGGGSTPPYLFSNPNIWLNGGRLLGETSCLGAPANGGDNAYLISTTAQGRADAHARVITAPALGHVVRRWSFNQPAGTAPAGTTVLDPVSGSALATVQGSGAVFTGKGLRLPGGASGSGAAYLQLPPGLISGYTNATVEIWAKTLSVQNWARLMDFNNGTGNYIMLTSSRGTNLGNQRFESKTAAATVTLDSDIPTATGVLHHYALTYASTGANSGRWTWYRDGDEIAYLDVAHALSAVQDVNNWLGRSAYGGDGLAHAEYAEVRISNVAMTRDQVAANARLGPNRPGVSANLAAEDAPGQSSFNAAGNWSDGLAPSAGKSYETYGFRLRTPADGTSRSFAGQALKLTGGSLTWKGTSSSTTTVNDLTLAGTDGEVLNAGTGTWTLAGNLKAEAAETMVRAANGPIQLTANLSGDGALLFTNNTVTLGGTNSAFTGKLLVGDGRFSGLSIHAEERLGANPATFTADQLTLNRGILHATANVTLDDANRGVRIGASAGIFNVAPGTTLTVAVPISGTSSGDTLVTAPLFPNPISGMFIKENAGTMVLTNPNNSHCGEIIISGGTFTLGGAGRLNNGDQHMPVVNNGTLHIDTSADQTLGGVISGNGSLLKNNSGTLSLHGANTMTGAVTISGGTLYARAGNAATNRNFSQVSGITVNSGATLRTGANSLFGWDGTQEKPVTVNAGGTLTADANADVGLGTVTLAGGTLANLGPSTAWGSWRFDNATDKLLVTQDSTVSATHVKFGDAAAAIEVQSGRTLTFTGTVTNATSGGTSHLRKTGAGTLVLAGANTHTGATSLEAGTTRVSGSLGSTAVTVAGGATLGGSGSIAGATAIAGTHAPGNSAGTQGFGSTLDYASTATLAWELTSNSTAAAAFDRVTATGAVTIAAGAKVNVLLNSAGSSVALNDAFWTQPRSWTFLTGSSVAGTFALGSIGNDPAGRPVSDHGTLSLQHGATSATLVFTPYTPHQLWQRAHFGTGWDNPAIAGDDVDGDQDGVANLLERAFGGDPNVAESGLLPAIDDESPRLSIVYRKALDATDLVFGVEESGDLTSPWLPAAGSGSVIEDNGSVQQIRFTRPAGTDDTLFLRLRVTRP